MGQVQGKGSIAQTAPKQEQGKAATPTAQEQLPETAEYPDPCGYGQTPEASELCAQWTAAVASRDSAYWAAKTHDVEVVGAAAVGISLFFSAAAAILALKAYRSTKRTEEAQTRAYVFPDSVAISDGFPLAGTKGEFSPPGAAVVLRNSGNTPAFDIQHWGVVELLDSPPEPITADLATMPKSNLPPGGTSSFNRFMTNGESPWWMTAVGADMLRRREARIYVHGRIEYRDVYGARRFTNYRLEYDGSWPPAPDAILRFSADGNESA